MSYQQQDAIDVEKQNQEINQLSKIDDFGGRTISNDYGGRMIMDQTDFIGGRERIDDFERPNFKMRLRRLCNKCEIL